MTPESAPERLGSPQRVAIAEAVVGAAKRLGASPAQVALAWILHQNPSCIPILGARTVAQLEDNLGCLGVVLDAAALEELEKVSAVELGFPHDFLAQERLRQIVHGGTWDQVAR